jgi:hypothetical protein
MALSVTLAELARTLAQTGNTSEAVQLARRALSRCDVGDCPGEIGAYRALAMAAAPDRPQMLEYADQAIRHAAAKHSRREEAVSRLVRAQILAGEPASVPEASRLVVEFEAMSMPWFAAQARAIVPTASA